MKNLKRIQKMDLEMQKLEKDIIYLKSILLKMQEIEERNKKLEKYYYSDWMEDYENGKDLNYGILSEDGLYNLFFEKESIEKKILKFLVKKL